MNINLIEPNYIPVQLFSHHLASFCIFPEFKNSFYFLN